MMLKSRSMFLCLPEGCPPPPPHPALVILSQECPQIVATHQYLPTPKVRTGTIGCHCKNSSLHVQITKPRVKSKNYKKPSKKCDCAITIVDYPSVYDSYSRNELWHPWTDLKVLVITQFKDNQDINQMWKRIIEL